jgi:hypothetical protein
MPKRTLAFKLDGLRLTEMGELVCGEKIVDLNRVDAELLSELMHVSPMTAPWEKLWEISGKTTIQAHLRALKAALAAVGSEYVIGTKQGFGARLRREERPVEATPEEAELLRGFGDRGRAAMP